MWTYWRLLEGEVYLNGTSYRTPDDRDPPVLHVEYMNTPVVTEDGREFPDLHFYTYLRYAAERVGGPVCRAAPFPIKIGPKAQVEPYGHANDLYQADEWFADYYCATLGYPDGPVQGLPGQLQGTAQWRHRRLHAGQCADLRLGRGQCLYDRRLQPRLQDDGRRQAGRQTYRHRPAGGGARAVRRCRAMRRAARSATAIQTARGFSNRRSHMPQPCPACDAEPRAKPKGCHLSPWAPDQVRGTLGL